MRKAQQYLSCNIFVDSLSWRYKYRQYRIKIIAGPCLPVGCMCPLVSDVFFLHVYIQNSKATRQGRYLIVAPNPIFESSHVFEGFAALPNLCACHGRYLIVVLNLGSSCGGKKRSFPKIFFRPSNIQSRNPSILQSIMAIHLCIFATKEQGLGMSANYHQDIS